MPAKSVCPCTTEMDQKVPAERLAHTNIKKEWEKSEKRPLPGEPKHRVTHSCSCWHLSELGVMALSPYGAFLTVSFD